MKITRTSMISGKPHTMDLDVTQEQIDLWQSGRFIQYAMPNLCPDERRFLMTGITPEEWATQLGENDSIDEKVPPYMGQGNIYPTKEE